MSRDLPRPGSPTTSTSWPSPARARSQRRASSPSSSSRPTNGVSVLAPPLRPPPLARTTAIKRQGLGDALQLVRALLLDDEEPGHLALHASRDQDRPWLSSSLDPRRDVRRFAEHFAGGVHHDRTGLDADAGGKLGRARSGVPCVEVGERALDGERGPHGALGVVLLRLRIAEQRHQPVAELLQHMAAKIGHRRRSFVEIGVDEVAPVFGVQLCGEARRADEIAEHHRDRAALGSGR